MADLAKYVVSLELESASYQRKLDTANKKLEGFEKRNQHSLGLLKKGFAALGAAISVREVGRLFADTARMAEELQRQATSLGASVESIQELTFTFRQFHLESNDVADALGTLADRARDAQDGTKSFIEDFALLGVSVDDLRNKRPEELLRIVADRIAGIEDPTRRTAGIVRIFGDDLGRKLAPLLIQGSEGLDKFAEKAHDANAVMAGDLVVGATKAQEAFRELAERGIGRLRTEIADLTVEWADAFRLIDLTPLEELQRELRHVNDRIESLGAFGGASAGAGQTLMEAAIAERDRLEKAIKRAELITPFAERRALIAARDKPPVDIAPTVTEDAQKLADQLTRGVQTSTEAAIEQWHQVLDAKAAGLISDETVQRWQDKLLQPIEITAERLPEILKPPPEVENEWATLGESMGRSMQDSLANAFLGVETNFGDMLKRMVAQAAASGLLNAIGAAIPGGSVVGKIAGFLGFGGARAEGGPVSPGKAFLVGERGPEMFVPDAAGRIVPNGGGAQVTQNITLHFDVGLESVDQRIAQAAPMVAAAAQAGIARAFGRPSMA